MKILDMHREKMPRVILGKHVNKRQKDLILSTLHTKPNTHANNVDPIEAAHKDIHRLPFCFIVLLISLFAKMSMSSQ